MKKRNVSTFQKLISSLTGGCVLFISCSKADLRNSDSNLSFKKDYFASDSDSVVSPFSLRSYLTEKDNTLMENLSHLSLDLLKDNETGILLKNDYCRALLKYGIDKNQLPENSLESKILLLLADPYAKALIKECKIKELAEYAKGKGIRNSKSLMPVVFNQTQIENSDAIIAFFPVAIFAAAVTIVTVEVAAAVHFAVRFWFAGDDGKDKEDRKPRKELENAEDKDKDKGKKNSEKKEKDTAVLMKSKSISSSSSSSHFNEEIADALLIMDAIDKNTKEAVIDYLNSIYKS